MTIQRFPGRTPLTIAFAATALLVGACTQPGPQLESDNPSSGAAVESIPASPQVAAQKQGEQAEEKLVAEPAAVAEPATTVWVANGMEDSLSVIDVASGALVATLPVGTNPHILSASADGRILYVINAGAHDRGPGAHGGGEAMDMQGSEGQMNEQGDEGHMMTPASAAAAASDASMATASAGEDMDMASGEGMDMSSPAQGNSLWALDTTTGEVLARVPVGQGPTHPVPSPDGKRVYVTNTDGDSVSVVDPTSWQVVATIPDVPEPHDAELTPDGRLLYVATRSARRMLWR